MASQDKEDGRDISLLDFWKLSSFKYLQRVEVWLSERVLV